jgi:hypothetical protein
VVKALGRMPWDDTGMLGPSNLVGLDPVASHGICCLAETLRWYTWPTRLASNIVCVSGTPPLTGPAHAMQTFPIPSELSPPPLLALSHRLLGPSPLPTHTAAPYSHRRPSLPTPPPYPMIPAPGHPSTTDGAGEAERPGSLQDAARDTTAAAVKRRGPTLRAAFCLYTTQRCSGGPFTRDPAWVGPLKL